LAVEVEEEFVVFYGLVSVEVHSAEFFSEKLDFLFLWELLG
jgi:hypothetical protein